VKKVVVIGSGPGGYTAAVRCAQLGLEVVIVEKGAVGGVCLNRGCIPTKALCWSAEVYNIAKNAHIFGVRSDNILVDMEEIQNRKNLIVNRLRQGLISIFNSYNIKVIEGEAVFLNKSSSSVLVKTKVGKDEIINFNCAVIASGSRPKLLHGTEPDGNSILTSDELLQINVLPSSLLIIGGGVIGIEFASIFSMLGVQVVVVELLEDILYGLDREVVGVLKRSLARRNVKIFTNAKTEEIRKLPDGKVEVTVVLAGSAQEVKKFVVEKVAICVGRKSNIEELQLENIGVRAEKGTIQVDPSMRTNVENVYAVGDVVGGNLLLAYVAAMQGIVAAENIAGGKKTVDYKVVPICIYSYPEIGCVGLTEEYAKERGYEIKVGKFPFIANGRAVIMNSSEGFVKVIADRETKEILGVHIVGPYATELVHQAVLSLHGQFVKEDFLRIMFSHPTLSEAFMEAVHDIDEEAIDFPRKLHS